MAKIVCPKCNAESYFSMTTYKGPYRCSGCKETFNIVIENDEVKSSQAMTDQDLNKMNIRTHYK